MSDSKKNPTKELAALRRVRNVYGAEAEREKRRLIDALAAAPPRNAAGLAHYHDDLLFIRAFPGDPETLKRAARALGVVERAFMKTPAKDRAAYNESGMTGAKTHHAFPYPLARWLARRAPSEAEFDWRAFDAARLELLLRLLMRANEREGFDSGEFTTRAWIKAARRVDAHSDLQWIVEALAAAPKAQQAAIEEMWTAAEPDIVWNLAGSRYSATRYMLAGAPVVMRRAMRKPPPDPARHIAKPLASVERLEPKRARAVIEAARVAISSRDREVTAMTSANPDEVYWCDLGEGVGLAVLGVAPANRMMIEANYGYLLVSNGAPIGYGGVTPLFRQANTGINIFDSYRGSEAAFLWTEMLRAFHTLFGVGRFIINGYQFGEGNSEAIASGAYWFYYHLGFRPAAPDLRKLAEREAARLARPRAAKSSKATLKALAQGDLHLDLPGFDKRDHFDEALLPQFSARAARLLSDEPAAARAEAEARISDRLAAALDVHSMRGWPAAECEAFAMLAPIVSIVPGLAAWPPEDKKNLVVMMRAKGHAQERDFAEAARQTPRFFRALVKELRKS